MAILSNLIYIDNDWLIIKMFSDISSYSIKSYCVSCVFTLGIFSREVFVLYRYTASTNYIDCRVYF